MEIYNKIIRRLQKDYLSLDKTFGEKKIKRIKKDLEYLKSNSYDFGVKKLTMYDLQFFYENIYKIQIVDKNNAKINNLVDLYKDRIEQDSIYFAYVSNQEKIIGGSILVLKDDKFILAFKANLDTLKNELKAGFGLILDYLFLEYGTTNLNFKYFSYGKDRNCYGYIGANIGLALYKLRLNFTPIVSETDGISNISINEIETPTLIFAPNINESICNQIYIKNIDDKTNLNFLKEKGFNIIEL